MNQWKTITNFQIAGQSNKKKMNFNVAIDHYFNLKSMYRKINAIKMKPSGYSFQNRRELELTKEMQNISSLLNSSTPQQMQYNNIDPEVLEAYQRYKLE